MRVMLLCLLVLAAAGPASTAPAVDGGWSAVNNGLQARLSMARKEAVMGTRIVATYFELRNTSDIAEPMDIPLDVRQVEFKVTDEAGKEIEPSDADYDGAGTQVGTIHLPYDSSVRYNITGRGAGVPRDMAAILDLGPGHTWLFKAGDKNVYYLQAKLTVAQPKDRRWSGTVELPRVRIPTVGE